MAGVKISALPASPGLDGTEIVPLVDGGITRRTTVSAIAALGSVDLSNYVGVEIDLEATGDGIQLRATGAGGDVKLRTDSGSITIGDDEIQGLYVTGPSNQGNLILRNTFDDVEVNIINDGVNGVINLLTTGDLNTDSDQVRINTTGSGGIGIFSASAVGSSGIAIEDTGTGDIYIQTDGAGRRVTLNGNGLGGSVVIAAAANTVITVEDSAGVATLGFYGTGSPVAQQTGVTVDIAAVHAALVNLGLITA